MHIVLKGIVEDYAKSFDLDSSDISKNFEYFVNYLLAHKELGHIVQPNELTTSEDDASLDGIAIFLDGNLITSLEMAEEILSDKKRKVDAKIILTQVKSGESFEKDDIANFLSGILNFLTQDNFYPQGTFNQIRHEILFQILKNVKNIRNGLPDIAVYFATSGIYQKSDEHEAIFKQIKYEIEQKTFFHQVKAEPLDRAKLISLYDDTNKDIQAKLKFQEFFAIPSMPNIPQSYLALVNAKDFIDSILFDEDKNIKNNIFEENIRAYLGEEVYVNSNIKKSLEEEKSQKIFSVLNNGITIISPDLAFSPSDKTIDLTNYQIINGCQTSNVLFENRDIINDDTKIIVKFISTTHEETITKIISSTNNQSNIDNNAFLGLKEKTRMVQRYFETTNNTVGDENRVYFERRQNEYSQSDYQKSRIFDLRTVVQAYNAMILEEPFNSSRYVKKIFESNELFKDDDEESLYYICSLALYKIHVAINSKKLKYSNLKWHVLFIMKYVATKSNKNWTRNSKKSNQNVKKIIETLTDKEKFENALNECLAIIESLPIPTSDEIKRQKYTADLRSKTFEYLNF